MARRSCAAPVTAAGRRTAMARFFTIDSETITNVASRKKTMSMSGMTSIRGRRLTAVEGIRMGLFRLHQQQLQVRGGILHLMPRVRQTGRQGVEGNDSNNGDAQPEGRGDQRFRN